MDMDVAGSSSPDRLLTGNGNVLKCTIPHSLAPPLPHIPPDPHSDRAQPTFRPHNVAQILSVLVSDGLDLKQLCDIKRVT